MSFKIDHVQLPVPNTSLASDWYTTHLGFTVLTQHDWLSVLKVASGPNLFLFRTSDKTAATFTVDGQPSPVIGAQVSDIAALHDKLITAGTPIAHFENADYGVVMKFFDPFGNMWVVYEPHEVPPIVGG